MSKTGLYLCKTDVDEILGRKLNISTKNSMVIDLAIHVREGYYFTP